MWNLRSDQRLTEWKRFRESLSELDLESAIKATTHLWSYAPFVGHYLDPARPEEWPNPWQLLDENYYCDLAKALGMLYTLSLTTHGKNIDLELQIVKDKNNNYSHLVFIDQGKYVINYWHDEIVNKKQVDDELQIKYSYTADDLKLHTF